MFQLNIESWKLKLYIYIDFLASIYSDLKLVNFPFQNLKRPKNDNFLNIQQIQE